MNRHELRGALISEMNVYTSVPMVITSKAGLVHIWCECNADLERIEKAINALDEKGDLPVAMTWIVRVPS